MGAGWLINESVDWPDQRNMYFWTCLPIYRIKIYINDDNIKFKRNNCYIIRKKIYETGYFVL